MATSIWNPNATDRLGTEWWVRGGAGETVSETATKARGIRQTYRSDAAESVDRLFTHLSWGLPGEVGIDKGAAIVEVMAAGSELASFGAWTGYAPNADFDANLKWRMLNSGTYSGPPVSGVTEVDEATPDTTDAHATYGTSGWDDYIGYEFATGAVTLTNQRTRLRVDITHGPFFSGGAEPGMWVTLVQQSTGKEWVISAIKSTGGPVTSQIHLPEFNPFTLAPWTQTDVRAFDSDYEIRLRPMGPQVVRYFIYTIRLFVQSATENRVAWGLLQTTDDGSFDIVEVNLGQPLATGSAWSKALNTTYSVHLRAAYLGSGLGSFASQVPWSPGVPDGDGIAEMALGLGGKTPEWNWSPQVLTCHALAGGVAPNYTGYAIARTVLDSVSAYASEATGDHAFKVAQDAGTFPTLMLVLRNDGGGLDVDDGLPYHQVGNIYPTGIVPVDQVVVARAGTSYDGVQFLVGCDPANLPAAALAITVADDTTNAVMGTGSLTVAEWEATPTLFTVGAVRWKLCSAQLASVVALTNGTDYRIRFTCTAGAAPASWWFQTLEGPTGGETGNTESIPSTYEGSAGFARWLGSPLTYADVGGVWLYDGPPEITAVALPADITAGWPTDPDVLDVIGCPPVVVPYLEVGWSAPSPAEGADFLRYTVQRRDAYDTTWRTVAEIASEADVDFDDYEARIGVDQEYRVRAENVWGPGPWSTLTTGRTATPGSPLLCFTANADRAQVVAAVDVYDREVETEYRFAEADEVQVMAIHGADGVRVFRPAESRLDRFSTRLLIAGVVAPDGIVGPRAFLPLRDMIRDPDLGYVCVRDHRGNRWLAAVVVPSAQVAVAAPGVPFFYVDVDVVETTAAPFVVED